MSLSMIWIHHDMPELSHCKTAIKDLKLVSPGISRTTFLPKMNVVAQLITDLARPSGREVIAELRLRFLAFFVYGARSP